MAYVSQELKASIAPKIKALLKQYGIKGSLRVDNHSTLVLTLKSGSIDFIKNYNETLDAAPNGYRASWISGHMVVNPFYIASSYTGKAAEFLTAAAAALKGEAYFDHSDSMTDYFHCSHYFDIQVGKWNAAYIVTA